MSSASEARAGAANYYEEGQGEDTGLDLTHVGPYEIVAPIGKGGFGTVYKAVDRANDRTVAIKVLYRRYDLDPRRRKRDTLLDELHAVSGLRHEHVVRMLDHLVEQKDAEGHVRRCLVMEYVDGPNLRTHIRSRDLTVPQLLDLAVKLCQGLDFLHQNGVIHKDVKPENFLLSRDGSQVKIVDFGLSEARPSRWERWFSRRRGGGTKAYMSPEQLEGRPVDARSDIFSLGLTLYELFTGRHPCKGPGTAEIMKQIRSRRYRFEAPSKLNREIPLALDSVILKALKRTPDRRYPSVTEMLLDLSRIRGSRI